MSDDRYGAHPDDYDDGGAHSPELDATRQPGYNSPPSYTVPGSPGAGQGYYPAAPYGQPGVPAADRTSGLAIAGLIVSIGSLLLNFFGLTAIIGIILSAVALQRDVKGRGTRGRGLAIAGIIVGVISLLLVIVILAAGIAYLNSGDCTTVNGTIHCDSSYSSSSGNL